jgi:nicotinamidase-related amidase
MATKQREMENTWKLLGDQERDHYQINSSTVDMTRLPSKPIVVSIAAQPQNIVVDLRKAAVIVIDMQNDFCSKDGWFDSMGVDVSPVGKLYQPIRRSVAAMRSRDVPIIWLNWGVRGDKANLSPVTLYPFNRVGCGTGLADPIKGRPPRTPNSPNGVLQKDAWGAAVVEELAPHSGDIFVDKHRISGFWDTPLDSILRNLSVKTLFFAGINTDQCVLATLMDANFHGYDTILLEDCTATNSPDFCMQATLHNVRFCFGFTVKCDDLVSGVAGTAQPAQ